MKTVNEPKRTDGLGHNVERLDLASMADDELIHLSALIGDELKDRAFQRGDLQELINNAFDHGFGSGVKVLQPWMHDNILIAPGGKFEKSALSHRCTFVRVQDQWVWESSQKLQDEIRNVAGPGSSMRSVTLIALNEGDKVDMLSSRTRSGVHELQEVQSFVYTDGKLEMIVARTVRSAGHR